MDVFSEQHWALACVRLRDCSTGCSFQGWQSRVLQTTCQALAVCPSPWLRQLLGVLAGSAACFNPCHERCAIQAAHELWLRRDRQWQTWAEGEGDNSQTSQGARQPACQLGLSGLESTCLLCLRSLLKTVLALWRAGAPIMKDALFDEGDEASAEPLAINTEYAARFQVRSPLLSADAR